MTIRVASIEAFALRVPLVEPFVIATGRLDSTDAIEVVIAVEHEGERIEGRGECATLPPVTRETPDAIARALRDARPTWIGRTFDDVAALRAFVFDGRWDATLAAGPVARAGVETAWLDVLARVEGRALAALLAPDSALVLRHETDITLPIAAPAHMGELAAAWTARGFRTLKVKVGRALEDDVAALRAIVSAAPSARLRLDANAALSSDDALRLLDATRALGGLVEVYEQPCLADDLTGMAHVVRAGGVPVIADESCQSLADVDRLAAQQAATGVNLKLVKNGGPLASYAIGARAKALGMQVMAGAMVETRLGLAAMLHVVSALQGVDYVDLDTALLLASDPFVGGYVESLPILSLLPARGVGVTRAP